MDKWVVAAAVGAVYLANYWNKVLKNGDNSSKFSSGDSYFDNPESPSCSFPFSKQAQRDKLGKDVSLDRRASDGKFSDVVDGLLTVEVASDRGIDSGKIRHFWNYNVNDVLSISNLPVSFSPNDNSKDIEDDEYEQSSNFAGNHGFMFPNSSAEVVSVCNSSRNGVTSLRMKHMPARVSRPSNSFESCLVAQLYKEHAKVEEYVSSSLSSPSSVTRSFLVSDGSLTINRANDNSFSALIGSKEYKLHKEACAVKDVHVFGVPCLLKFGSVNEAKKMNFNAFIGQSRRLSSSNDGISRKHIHTQCDKTFLFSLGISFGIITSIMANKRESDKLKELLNQTENLVQDLQEELDMKDSMTVKELHNENYGSQDAFNHSVYDKELNGSSPEKNMDNTPRVDCKVSYDQREEQSLESMNRIEAELEAELERLGLDMHASSLERKVSELVELDPDFVADFAQGELRADMVNGEDFVHPKSNGDANDTTPLLGNHAVSPRELSLRLHEVIQCQLEKRVKELEITLENSERKVQLMESKCSSCSQKAASSFTRGKNLLTYEDCDPMDQPLILNLSGEALDTYNEVYEELIKIDHSDEYSPSGIDDSSDQKEGSY